MGVDPLVQGRIGSVAAVAFGNQHLEQLPPSCHQGTQVAGRLIGQRTHRWPDRFRETGNHCRVQPICLGQLAHRASEGSHPARVDDRDRQAGRGQSCGKADLHAARGLENDQRRRNRDQALDQCGHTLVIVAEGGALAGGA